MIDEKTYQPVSCDLYDHLEIAAMRGHKVMIEYANGGIQNKLLTTIKTLKVIDHAEFLVTAEDEMIRLDWLSNIYDEKGNLLVSFLPKSNC